MQEHEPTIDFDFFRLGVALELALVLVAAGIGWIVVGELFPFPLRFDAAGIGLSLAATVPPAIFAVVATSPLGQRVESLRGIHQRVRSVLGRPLLRATWYQILAVSFAAGIGEEILFRGVVQELIEPELKALLITSVLFGLLHALTPTYFLLATIIGLYLGWLYQLSDNILPPIVVHSLYDALALALFRRRFAREVAAGEVEGLAIEDPTDEIRDPS